MSCSRKQKLLPWKNVLQLHKLEKKHKKLQSYFNNKTYSAIQTQSPVPVRPWLGSLRVTFRHHEAEVTQQINLSFKAQEAQVLSQQNSTNTALS